ncbi:MAG: crotonase/enoyl-CoA hydratase family protein, partial [Pseudomonadota bacterium]
TIEDDVATILMDDGKANAISHAMLDALNEGLDKAEADAKAIVLAGRDSRFSGGFDLKVMMEAKSGEEVVALVKRGGELAYRLYSSKLPVIAACTGHAVAMGAFILLSCDTRIGASGPFKLGANETAINMVLPPFAHLLTLERLAPTLKTRAVIQAELFNPEMAVQAGYLDQVVAPEAVLPTAQALAKQMTQFPPAYAGNKKQLRGETLKAMRASLDAA